MSPDYGVVAAGEEGGLHNACHQRYEQVGCGSCTGSSTDLGMGACYQTGAEKAIKEAVQQAMQCRCLVQFNYNC